MDPNTVFIAAVSVIVLLGIILTALIYFSDFLQKDSRPMPHPTHKHA